MNIEHPRQISLLIAGGVGVIPVLISIVAYLNGWWQIPLWVLISYSVSSFVAGWLISWWAIETFLHGKIKLIYRTIFNPMTREERLKSASSSGDQLGTVQRDVQEWARTKQQEIQSLRDQAKFRRDFIGNLAHELRTPIFNMQGYLHTLIEGGVEDSKINYDYLARADKNLDRLVVLIEDLDQISRLESGNTALKEEKFNLVKLVDEVFQLLELSAEKKKIKLRFNEKYDKPIQIVGDRSKILQVFTNLIMNAIHYGKKGGFCKVRFFNMSENVLVEVSDDGIGVEAEHLPRLFERFYRVDKSRSRHEGGTGLGLAICKHIIESHGQSISVRSVVDKGTTFSFTLEKAK